jgi:hypothetical protein
MKQWTEKDRRNALTALEERKEKSKHEKKINNAELYAGSPMYYYCHLCGLLAEVLPETHMSKPKAYCDPCQELTSHGYMPSTGTFNTTAPER